MASVRSAYHVEARCQRVVYPWHVIEDPASVFRVLAPLVALGVPLYAARVRSRQYAAFAAVVLLLSIPGTIIVHERLVALVPAEVRVTLTLVFGCLMAATGIHLASLVSPRLRARPFRYLVSVPGQLFLAAGFLAGVWLLLLLPVRIVLGLLDAERLLHALAWADLLPFAVVALSLVTTQRPASELVRIPLGKDGPARVTRVPVARYRRRTPPVALERPLRIVQIADPHLGPWQPVPKLRRHIESLLARWRPDLVLLTGDFLTMEAAGTPGALATALEPLRALPGRCISILGNHDYDALGEVRSALAANGVELLVDAERIANTDSGPVQIIGADYRRDREEHIPRLLERFPHREGHLCIFLLHDPSGFRFVPPGAADLTLSGHTHGGQIGLVSLGLDWTVLTHSRWPDHGLFALGPNRLYVHRGTGFYGFPLRIGVPGESSLLEVAPPWPIAET